MTATVHIAFRPLDASDLAYVMSSWRASWRLSATCRRTTAGSFDALFRDTVRNGVMPSPDTCVLVGCSTVDPSWIWSWLCYEPGPVPVVHYAMVRPRVENGEDEPQPLRRIGILTRMLGAAGVRSELVYTFRPAERVASHAREHLHVEDGLLGAAEKAGITAVYRPIHKFLSQRRHAA